MIMGGQNKNGEPFDKAEFPLIEDGVRGMDFIEKTIESNSKGNIWVELNN